MSKIVKIPECMEPNFSVWINGEEFSYPAGVETEVPDHVAAVIEHHMAHHPEHLPSGGGSDGGSGGGSGGGGVFSWNDLTDKPFYEAFEEATLIDEPAVESKYDEGGDFYYANVKNIAKTKPSEGTVCHVTYSLYGEVYEEDCVVDKSNEISFGANVAEENNWGGEYRLELSGYSNELLTTPGGSGADVVDSIKVTCTANVLKTIDSKFLPKGNFYGNLTEAPTAENFNTLLTALREAGYLSE